MRAKGGRGTFFAPSRSSGGGIGEIGRGTNGEKKKTCRGGTIFLPGGQKIFPYVLRPDGTYGIIRINRIENRRSGVRCYRFAGGDGPRDSTVHRRKLKKIKWRVVCPATGFSAQSAVEDSGMKDGTMPVPTEKRARNVSKAVRCSVSAFSDEKEKGCGAA